MGFHSIVEAVHAYAGSQPDALCLADAKRSFTYSEAWGRITGAGNVLLRAGLRPGDRVLVEHTQDALFSIALLAVQAAGGVFVPLERGVSFDRLERILAETSARFFLGKYSAKRLPDGVCILDTAELCENCAHFADDSWSCPFPSGDETAEILFSTGTTGKSKGIELTHSNVIAVAENVVYGVEMQPGNVEMIFAPLSHSHGLRRHYANLLRGNAVVLCESVVFVQNVFELIDRYAVTAMDIVPSAMKMLLKLSGSRLADYGGQLRYVQLGSAPLEQAEKARLRKLLPQTRLYDFYGSTEAGCSCIIDFNREPDRAGCIGKPTVNSEIRIVDENRNPLAGSSAEHPGFIACRGSMLMKGYWRQPELTESVVSDGFIYTTDRGYFDSDGYLYLLGREDDVINCGGIKINPEEIECAALRYAPVAECACAAKKETASGEVPVLFLLLKEGELFEREALMTVLAASVDANKLPRDIRIVTELPHTYNGKLQRSKLREELNKG